MLQEDAGSITGTAQPSQLAIADYAIVGDCRTAALISRTGSIDWLCLPHFSGGSVFAALLDQERGGRFAIWPAGDFRSSRRYLPGTPVLETTFRTSQGEARILDLMPISQRAAALEPMREILRVAEGVNGDVELLVRFEPRPDYARANARIRSRGALGWACAWKNELFLLRSERPLEVSPDRRAVFGRLCVREGERICLSLAYTTDDIAVVPLLGEDAQERVEATLRWWRKWSERCAYGGPYRAAVERSAIVLKLMTFALSGAVVAAPTTSLPEALGGSRNWDYRYCWLRDAALTTRAFTALGYRDEARAFLRWMLHATRLTWPKLQVMYDVYGRTDLNESELSHLAGFRDSRPVRIGNAAHRQTQLDVYGEVLSAACELVESGESLQRDEAKLLGGFAKTVCEKWREPDHGIWEMRGPKRHHTVSKVMCWVALDSAIRLHTRGAITADVQAFSREREAIAAAIEARGFNEVVGSYTAEFDGERLDAAVLLMGCYGYNDPAHPRMQRTRDRIGERLGSKGLLYRYEPGSDGLPEREGAFGICSFWLVENLARAGDLDRAKGLLDRVLACANDLGLYAEEIDVATGAALGNFPQAFTHVGLINAAVAIAENEQGRRR